jgi:putative ABC transport system permease protein
LTYEPEIHGSAQAVKYLNLISIFILIIAWINYINLTTAKSLDRAKEVGIRKVVGAKKVQLIRQFLTESMVINLISAVSAIVLVQLALPYFNRFAGKTIMEFAITDQFFLLQLSIFFFIGIFAAGFYPALVLASFKPKQIIQGNLMTSSRGHLIRRTLVVLQFALSVILIASTIIVYQQVRYMLNKNLGIDISKVIGVLNPTQIVRDDQSNTRYIGFLTELERQTGVLQAASISNLPGGGSSDISSNSGGIKIVGKTERKDGVVYINEMDDEIKDVLGISILFGRNFDRNRPTDTMSVIVNEAFLTMLDIEPSEALVNEQIQFGRDPQNQKYSIIGVIQNFNRSSLKNHVEPTVLLY